MLFCKISFFYAKNASSSAFVGHFTFFLNSFERRGKNTSQEYFPHFSLELSHRQHQVDGIVREISLSSDLELLWVRPQTQKQGILRTAPTKNERSRSRNHSTNSTRKSCSWMDNDNATKNLQLQTDSSTAED